MKATFNNLVTVAQQINNLEICKYTIRVYKQHVWYNIGLFTDRGEVNTIFGLTARECMVTLENMKKFHFVNLYGSR